MDNQRKFGVWMDNYNAQIVGPSDNQADSIMFLAQVEGEKPASSASEKNGNNQEKMLPLHHRLPLIQKDKYPGPCF